MCIVTICTYFKRMLLIRGLRKILQDPYAAFIKSTSKCKVKLHLILQKVENERTRAEII